MDFKEKVTALIERELQEQYTDKCPRRTFEKHGRTYELADTNAIDQVMALQKILEEARAALRDLEIKHVGTGQRPKKPKGVAAAQQAMAPSKPVTPADPAPPKNGIVSTKAKPATPAT